MTETFEVARVDREEIEPDSLDSETPIAEQKYPVVHVFGYDSGGNFKHGQIVGFEPYCYVPYEEIEAVDTDSHTKIKRFEIYDDDGEPFTTVRGRRVAKCITYLPGDVPDARDEFSNSWESDVLFPTRFIIDLNLTSGIVMPTVDEQVHVDDVSTTEVNYEWRIHYMDIEVDDRNGFPEEGTEPILCITAYDSFNDEYITWLQGEGEHGDYDDQSDLHPEADVSVRWFEDEAEMLVNYISYVSGTSPSIITGWNVDDFDLPYLFDRCEVLSNELDDDDPIDEIPYQAMSPMFRASNHNYFGVRIKGVSVFDLLQGFEATQFSEMDSYRLDAVAEATVGQTKETYVGTIGSLWEDDPEMLVDYNLRDVELTVEIDRLEEVITFWREVKSTVGCQLGDAPVESTAADRYILNEYHGEVVFPNQGSQEESEDDFGGGAVFEPIDGIRDNVPTLDLASLYPMSMLTLNASPETKVNPDEYDGPTFHSPNGIHFRKDKDGLTRRLIEDLLERRDAKKAERDSFDPDSQEYAVRDRQQTALKVIMNTLYGVMAWSRFRLYDQDVASAVTATGRAVIQHTASTVEDIGYEVLYGDTDSVLLDVPDKPKDETIELCFEIEDQINDSYDEFALESLNAEYHRFDIEFEKLYKRYFQSGTKKRYAGHIVWKEGKDVDDVDITGFQYKRSDHSAVARQTQKEVIDRIVHGATTDDIAEYVEGVLDDWEDRHVALGDIGVPEGIGSDLFDYKSDTHPVRAAKYGNLLLGTTFASGSKPKRYYLSDVNPAMFRRLENEEGFHPGRDRMYAEFKENPWIIAADRPQELASELVFDWERMRAKNLKEPLAGILRSLGIEWEELLADSRQAGLEAFT